ncbi:MAG: hypothetical protein KF901_10710 [Myxococcales bacterium]|nr:hypothetical protein [Myxococcales bacterium]
MQLTPWEKRWLTAIFEGFAPPASAADADARRLQPRPGEVDWAGAFVQLNEGGSPIAQAGLRAAIHLIGTSPAWMGAGAASMEGLAVEARAALLERLAQHPLRLVRELTWLMKVQASMALFGTPSVRARSGYDRDRAEKTPVRLRTKRELPREEVV